MIVRLVTQKTPEIPIDKEFLVRRQLYTFLQKLNKRNTFQPL